MSAPAASADRGLEPGQHVGEYVIESKIGEGGFGAVYRARHPLIGKLVAVKVLAPRFSADPEILSRFVDEARAVNQIRHRNIIDIFSFGQLEDDRSYYVMELLDGQPLDQLIDDAGPCALGDAIPILRGIARALDAAHTSGIAHRDLKPENVYLTRESDGAIFPKLLDFGIAKLLGDRAAEQMHKTRTGAPIGTPYYMSPEQCRGRDVDHRTDIYAFGCVAYKLLTGVVPFDGDTHMDVLMKQIGEEAVPPSERVPGLPPGVDDVVAWLLRKDPAERPPDLMTAVRALEDVAAGAGLAFPAPHTPTSMAAQRTPSAITPLPARGSAPRFAVAPTVMAEAPRRRSRLWIAAAVVAAAGVGAFATVALTRGEGRPAGAPPAASSPAPPVTPPAAPPLPALVTIEIVGAPVGTDVYGPAGPLGAAPGQIQLVRGPDEVQLVLQADGHESAITRVVPDGDKTIEVALTPRPRPPAPATAEPTSRSAIRKRAPRPRPRPATPPAAASPADPKKPPVVDPFARK